MLLTIPQAAARAGVKPGAILARIKSGKLPAQKMGRDWMIEEAALTAWQPDKPGPRSSK